jgi:3-oxoadipate enol-lactonase
MIRTGPRGGAPLLFLHALGLDLSVWDHQIQALARDHDVIAIDLPGHGLSPRSEQPPTLAAFAQALSELITTLRAGPADVVGISVGGMIAQALATTAPEQVRSLTLVATSCTFADPVRDILRQRADTTRTLGMKGIAPLHLARWFPAAFLAARPEVGDRLTKLLLGRDPAFHAQLWEMVAGLSLDQAIASLTCPTLVVAGADDASAPPAAGQQIVDRMGHARLVVLPDCGHFPPLEHPEAFNALLRDFLARQRV